MKNLFVMLTLVVASAVTSTAEAALRLTLTSGATTQVYYFADNEGGTVNFTIGSFTGSADVIASNNPGQIDGPDGLGLVSQSLSLKTTGSVSNLGLTSVLEVIQEVVGLVSTSSLTGLAGGDLGTVVGQGLLDFYLPGVGPAEVLTQLTGNAQTPVQSGSATSETTVDGVDYANTAIANVKLGLDSQSDFTVITGPYTLSNSVVITGFTTTGRTTGQGALITSTSSVRGNSTPSNLVPEPTSMALAGFAGIGMAFGAIRRRRQVNQAA